MLCDESASALLRASDLTPVQRDLYGRRCAGWLAGGRTQGAVA